jgi:hypothetical protein
VPFPPPGSRAPLVVKIVVPLVVVALVGLGVWFQRGALTPAGTPSSGPTIAERSAAPTPSPSATPSSTSGLRSLSKRRAAELRRIAAKAERESRRQAKARETFSMTVSNFNTLGAAHTAPGGKDPNMASGYTRGGWAAQLFLEHHVDLGAVQEFERPQALAFERTAGDVYDVWPGTSLTAKDGENSVVWRRSEFVAVRELSQQYHYFGGGIRNYPLVLLRQKQTGIEFWMTSYHNPADTKEFGNQEKWKHLDVRMEIPDINHLLATTRLPLIVSGDMNDRQGFFCPVVGNTPLHASNGGSATPTSCDMPRPHWIDWILGSDEITFSDYRWDDGAFVNKTSDHPMVITEATMKRGPGQPVH